MPSIHLIKKRKAGLPDIEKVQDEHGVFSSGYWTLSEEKARSLIGGQIYFHEQQSQRSYFGGQILDARRQAVGDYEGKIVFRFKSSSDCRDILTTRDGWSQEMKIAL